MIKPLLPLCAAILFCIPAQLIAQCPTITCPSTVAASCSSLGVQVTATSNYSANITSSWIGNVPFSLMSSGTSTSTIYLNHAGTYTVQLKDNLSGCISTQTVLVVAPTAPTFDITVSGVVANCVTIYNSLAITNPQANLGGNTTYAVGLVGSTPVFGPDMDIDAPYCGKYYLMVKDVSTGCVSSYSIQMPCPGPDPFPNIAITSSNSSICVGSSNTLSAFGTAVSHTWSTGSNSNLIIVTPAAPTTYWVSGTSSSGCISTYSVNAIICDVAIGETDRDQAGVRVFPNPSSGKLNLQSDVPTEIPYTLYDMSGRQIIQGELIRSRSLDLSALEGGLYLLQLQTPDGLICKRLVVE
jgi:hypothetical protein